jgi:hypothetical protein
MDWWQIDHRGALDQVEAGDHGCPGLPKVEHPAVPEPPDRAAPSTPRDVIHQRDQPPCDLRSGFVAALLGQAGVPGQVNKADGWWLRHSLLETGALKCLLDVVDGVLGPDVLATAAIDHQKHSLQQPDDPVAELGADLNQLTLV